MDRTRGARGRRSAGFTMVALVIGMLILTITIAAVGPALGMIGRREREQELMFRGKQYARAIGLFQRRYGRYPNTLKELYENNPRTIRKLWKDPICNCSDWYLLILNSPDANPVLGGAGAPAPPAGGPRPSPTPTPPPAGAFGAPQAAGPIVGVRSRVHKEALTAWRGQTYYDQWRFIVGDADREATGAFDSNSLRRPPGQPPALTPGR
ncbi:MAG: type II secretion system GspH family protein [Acidobacteriota bacterium]|nr:type II secretion system GspH family protein [Acidobacteriota bacterium]